MSALVLFFATKDFRMTPLPETLSDVEKRFALIGYKRFNLTKARPTMLEEAFLYFNWHEADGNPAQEKHMRECSEMARATQTHTSMSAGDLVMVSFKDKAEWWWCGGFGWKQLTIKNM